MQHCEEADRAFAAGHFSKAAKTYQRGIEAVNYAGTDPEGVLPLLLCNQAQAYLELQRFAEAAVAASAAARHQPTLGKAYLRLAAARWKLGQFEEALAACDDVPRLAPGELEAEAASLRQSIVDQRDARNAPPPPPRTAPTAGGRTKKKNRGGGGSSSGDANNAAAVVVGEALASGSSDPSAKGPDGRPSLKHCFAVLGDKCRFFPAGPLWFDDRRVAIVPAARILVDGAGLHPNLLHFTLSSYAEQVALNRGYVSSNCENCKGPIGQWGPSPPQCICGEVYCSPECFQADWKGHRKICKTIEDNCSFGMKLAQRFWGLVRAGVLPWNPNHPCEFPPPAGGANRQQQHQKQQQQQQQPQEDDSLATWPFVSNPPELFSSPEYHAQQRDAMALLDAGFKSTNFIVEAENAVARRQCRSIMDYAEGVERPFVRDTLSRFSASREDKLGARQKTIAGRRNAVAFNVARATVPADFYIAQLASLSGERQSERLIFSMSIVGNTLRLIDQMLRQVPDMCVPIFDHYINVVLREKLTDLAVQLNRNPPPGSRKNSPKLSADKLMQLAVSMAEGAGPIRSLWKEGVSTPPTTTTAAATASQAAAAAESSTAPTAATSTANEYQDVD